MKNIYYLLISILIFGNGLIAQNIQPILNTPAPIVEDCGTDQVHQQMMATDPAYRKSMDDFNLMMSKAVINNKAGGVIYRVPVVVHVMHLGEAVGVGSNISEAAINQGIRQVNERWRKVAGSLGDGGGVDLEIEFALAVRDPSNNCTNGIVRVDMSGNATYVNSGLRAQSAGITEATLRAASRWTPTDYYNIYLVSEIDNNDCGFGIQGYAYLAGAHGGAQDGMYQLGCKFATSGNTTLTHELGHAWNLYHTFEGDGGGGACPTGTGDFCADTPDHRRSSSDCIAGAANPCDAGTSDLHIHNYMDYSSDVCQSEFTANQEGRASATMIGTRASFLEVNGNMSLVPPAAAGVDFVASSSAVCFGTPISFYDESTCVPNTYQNGAWTGITFLWTFDNGVNPAITSTLQNPTINFANAGTYNVTLAVTTGAGTSTVTKNGFVNIASGTPAAACIPTSTNEGNFGQTINNVQFNTISNSTSTVTNVAYTDFSCTNATSVEIGSTYALSISVSAGGSGAEGFEVYIDYNNNGTFAAGEMIMSNSTPSNSSQTFTQNIAIPGTAVIGTLLRMRVVADAGASISICGNNFIGEAEDYGVFVTSSIPQPPVADFSGTPTSSCAAPLLVNFTDLSTGSPALTGWQWDIDNNGSIDYTTQNPSHTYSAAGNYTVSLIATNANGSNIATKVNYISVGGGAVLPFVEGFEGPFPPTGWAINNLDAATVTWDNSPASGNGGTNAARVRFYNYGNLGQKDELITNRIDISAVASSSFTFDVAYTQWGSETDQLKIYLSTDCGATYPNLIYDKSGATLETLPNIAVEFVPTIAGEWRNETVDLTPYVGNSIMMKFESTTQFGNNLFLDNINITGAGSLPVELLYFDANAGKSNNVLLDWQTAAEINNDYFVIERSTDGKGWKSLEKFNGAGNSNGLKTYKYIDVNPYKGVSYYRLKQVDFDGALTHSETKAVSIGENIEANAYPNPFHDNLNFDIYADVDGEILVEVYSLLGSIVKTKKLVVQEGNNIIQTNFSELVQGSYIVKLSNGSTFQERFKITKQ